MTAVEVGRNRVEDAGGGRFVDLASHMLDFLAYIGYKPKRRLFQPGQERPYNLKSGAHSTVSEYVRLASDCSSDDALSN